MVNDHRILLDFEMDFCADHPVPISRLMRDRPEVIYDNMLQLITALERVLLASRRTGIPLDPMEMHTWNCVMETIYRCKGILSTLPQWVTWEVNMGGFMSTTEFREHTWVEDGDSHRRDKRKEKQKDFKIDKKYEHKYMEQKPKDNRKTLKVQKKLEAPKIVKKKEDNRETFKVQKKLEAPKIEKKKVDNRATFKVQKKLEAPKIAKKEEENRATFKVQKKLEAPKIEKKKEDNRKTFKVQKKLEAPKIEKKKVDNRATFKVEKKWEAPKIEARKKEYIDDDGSDDDKSEYTDDPGSSSGSEDGRQMLMIEDSGEKQYVGSVGSDSEDNDSDERDSDERDSDERDSDERDSDERDSDEESEAGSIAGSCQGSDRRSSDGGPSRSRSRGRSSSRAASPDESEGDFYRHSPSRSRSRSAHSPKRGCQPPQGFGSCGQSFVNEDKYKTTASRFAKPKTTNPYDILGLSAGINTPQEDIKAAYQSEMRLCHPNGMGGADEDQTKAHERTVKVQLAYDILKDPEKRAIYDELKIFDESEIERILEKRGTKWGTRDDSSERGRDKGKGKKRR
ncbi:DnaJ-domain-containing protein [Massarina eburnea CBS 473.64]|uniref:DnaJ-domain-containing protein n=1 Tax=Massarina eburnea CBS 473.64 TaxID=1395130 RepID=A0A6A6SKL5_9PLEO|nr:DnaJ-domain-containing protein [Massarina eburnea CBS 473.64]